VSKPASTPSLSQAAPGDYEISEEQMAAIVRRMVEAAEAAGQEAPRITKSVGLCLCARCRRFEPMKKRGSRGCAATRVVLAVREDGGRPVLSVIDDDASPRRVTGMIVDGALP